MRATWLPWRLIIRRLARSHGITDPVALLARIQSFSHPSEVAVPMELLRAGILFHARGLINTKVIQQNLDWVWPYWITEQFNPHSGSFLPRAFSITHVNLTHRNWTAAGIPDCEALPIVDPRGLVTPLFDGWSLDAWIVRDDGKDPLIPARSPHAQQKLVLAKDDFAIETRLQENPLELAQVAHVTLDKGRPFCSVTYRAHAAEPAWLAVCLRPYNPEGVSFIHEIRRRDDRMAWLVGSAEYPIGFDRPIQRMAASCYRAGDLYPGLLELPETTRISCDVGLATAAALFPIALEEGAEVTVRVPLSQTAEHQDASAPIVRPKPWHEALSDAATLDTPDRQAKYLYDAAVRTLILHTPGEVYPGPYTYKRFWFRDTAFMLHAALSINLVQRVLRVLDTFPARQRVTGYFHSQDGEWDSNGQALWIMHRYGQLTGTEPKDSWRKSILRGARWIHRKRTSSKTDALHAGLLPAGFSAEHLGNNDFYYWDDFWGVAGLRAAAAMARHWDETSADQFEAEAREFMAAIERTLAASFDRRGVDALPASPYRRMDSGAVGSLCADFPLHLLPPGEARMMQTIEFLLARCMVHGAFFQDMIHSGINAYLTLHMAQVLLRAGDMRFLELLHAVIDLASPTGQWPEAIHPHTGGGCMGDGQHAWAAAEYLTLVRNMFVREEQDTLVLASGIPPAWCKRGAPAVFGPTPTPWGTVRVSIETDDEAARVAWDADWTASAPAIEVALPHSERVRVPPGEVSVTVTRLRPEAPRPVSHGTGL
jgi:hypothetical protein